MFNPETLLGAGRPSERVARLAWLDALANVVQPPVLAARDGAPAPVKSALHGTFLGHTLHPVLTDIPVGAWTVTALLDTFTLAGRDDAAFAADASLGLGLLGGVGAMLTGLAEWSDTAGPPRALGMAHALLNSAAFCAYAASLACRLGRRRKTGALLAFAGYGLVTSAAYFGGELSLGMQIGARHTGIPIDLPDDFTRVLPESELAIGALKRVSVVDVPVVLARTETAIYALTAACTHRGAPLDEGTLDGGCVRCPWHGSAFDLHDGSVREGPATFAQAPFDVRIRDGHIEIRARQ